jgi:methylase of polypeptide subunit release factors
VRYSVLDAWAPKPHSYDRQDTAAAITHLAELVRDAPDLPDELRVLDLCTGTGCIPLLFRHEFAAKRKDITLRILGIDISEESMDLARYNLRENESDPEVREGLTNFARADVLANPFADLTPGAPLPVKNVLNHNRWKLFWDILISNPPYISPSAYWKTTTRSVRAFEPKLALVPPNSSNIDDTQQGDFFYPQLLKFAQELETKVVLLEVADLPQALRVARLAKQRNLFDGIEIWRDDPEPTSGEPTVEDGFDVLGNGNARSVVCWRGQGAAWLGKSSAPEAAEPLEREISQELAADSGFYFGPSEPSQHLLNRFGPDSRFSNRRRKHLERHALARQK